MSQSEFKFSFILQGYYTPEQQMDLTDKLIEAGCDYPEVTAHNGVITLEFFAERTEEQTMFDIMMEELKRVESTGAKIFNVAQPDEITVSDLAERGHINKMTASRLSRRVSTIAKDFPEPCYGFKWSWSEVSRWMFAKGGDYKIDRALSEQAEAVRVLSHAIMVRNNLQDEKVAQALGNFKLHFQTIMSEDEYAMSDESSPTGMGKSLSMRVAY